MKRERFRLAAALVFALPLTALGSGGPEDPRGAGQPGMSSDERVRDAPAELPRDRSIMGNSASDSQSGYGSTNSSARKTRHHWWQFWRPKPGADYQAPRREDRGDGLRWPPKDKLD